jgi:hypothetical protein
LFPFRAMTEIRRKITRKCNLDFLTTAEYPSSSYRRVIQGMQKTSSSATACYDRKARERRSPKRSHVVILGGKLQERR